MQRLFESKLPKGFIDLYEAEGHLVIVTGFNRDALGVGIDIPDEEAADMAEALLKSLSDETRASVIESVCHVKA